MTNSTSAWNPLYTTEDVCTPHRQGNTHMAGYGVQLTTTRSLLGRSRKMRGCAVDGHLIEWVIWKRIQGICTTLPPRVLV
jgi:hypothetical protein